MVFGGHNGPQEVAGGDLFKDVSAGKIVIAKVSAKQTVKRETKVDKKQ